MKESGFKDNFISRCLSGHAQLSEIDEYIRRWHEGEAGVGLELFEYLGLTTAEHERWAQDESCLQDIIDSRKRG